jgi:apolipoprotein N-acyltransferase
MSLSDEPAIVADAPRGSVSIENTTSPRLSRRAMLTTLLLGVLATPGFLPADLWHASLALLASLLPILSLTVMALLWQRYAALPRQAFKLGFIYGLGFFGAGVYWIIIAMTTFGGMAGILALIAMLVLVSYLSLYPALVGYALIRLFKRQYCLWALPALWGLSELARAWFLDGFPWLSLGYAQALPSPLAGLTPVGGVYLTSVASVLLSVCLAFIMQKRWRVFSAALAMAILVGGWLLTHASWTHVVEEPLPVSLIQGNIAQDIKFDPEFRAETYARYRRLAEQSKGRLVVLPESAFPDFADKVPDEEVIAYQEMGRARDGDFLIGMFTRRLNPDKARDDYFNSVVSLGDAPTQLYRKRHLVLFGEKIPFESVIAPIMHALISIPIAGQSSGTEDQPPFAVAGQQVAVSICFEDVFGAEQRERVRNSTLLVNFTNDAWYGHSIATWQHHRIASIRALESGRAMLRVTNTGVTSLIDYQGRTAERLPWFEEAVLETETQGRSGNTPYLRWGDWFVFGLIILLLLTVALVQRKNFSESRNQ